MAVRKQKKENEGRMGTALVNQLAREKEIKNRAQATASAQATSTKPEFNLSGERQKVGETFGEKSLIGLTPQQQEEAKRQTALIGQSLQQGQVRGETPREQQQIKEKLIGLTQQEIGLSPIEKDEKARQEELTTLSQIEAANQREQITPVQEKRNKLLQTELTGELPTPATIFKNVFDGAAKNSKSKLMKDIFSKAAETSEVFDINKPLVDIRKGVFSNVMRFTKVDLNVQDKTLSDGLTENLKLMEDQINLLKDGSPLYDERTYKAARSNIFNNYGKAHKLNLSVANQYARPEIIATMADYEEAVINQIPVLDTRAEILQRQQEINKVSGIELFRNTNV